VSKEHSLAGEPEPGAISQQAPGLEERLEIRAKPAPDVNPVARLYGICIDSVNQAERGEQGIAELRWSGVRRRTSIAGEPRRAT